MEVKREHLIDKRDILLFDILKEIRELKALVGPKEEVAGGVPQPKEKVVEAKPQPKKKYKCKTCGKEYDRSVDVATCAKKHKKEGGS